MSQKHKLCALACLAMIVLAMIPQIHLWIVRGHDWNGAYVSTMGDELLYSAYVNALITGRTRRNDPFGARDDTPIKPLPESIYSIQFVPAYVIALPARGFQISASTAFILLVAGAALAASVCLFLLLNAVTSNCEAAAAGTVFVLTVAALAGGHGLVGGLLKADLSILGLPFLRRYQPAALFSLFFVFQFFVWRALTSSAGRAVVAYSLVAALSLVTLIFSYVYLWTAAAAWLVCINGLWFYLRRSDRSKTFASFGTIGLITVFAIAAYAYLLSMRTPMVDEQQILISTHWPDLLHVTELLGAIVIVALIAGVKWKAIEIREPKVIYLASLALLPFVVFNQQVLTGKMMQVYHFEAYVVNYTTLVAVLLLATLFSKSVSRRVLVWITALCFLIGMLEVAVPSKLFFVPAAVAKDKTVPVLRRLADVSRQDGTVAGLRTYGEGLKLVFSPEVSLIALLPTWTSHGALLDISGVDCGSITYHERREFYYMHLYYSASAAEALRTAVTKRDQFAVAMIFGYEKVFPALSSDFKPLQDSEIDREVQNYQAFINSFSREQVLKRPITYAVIPVEGGFDFTNLDRWYERDPGERVGDYVLYRLKLKLDAPSPNPLPKGEG